MSIEEKIDIIGDSLSDIKGAIIAKGVTPSGNITTYANAIGSISGGTTPTGTLSITANGVYDVTNYASANVSVPQTVNTVTGDYRIYLKGERISVNNNTYYTSQFTLIGSCQQGDSISIKLGEKESEVLLPPGDNGVDTYSVVIINGGTAQQLTYNTPIVYTPTSDVFIEKKKNGLNIRTNGIYDVSSCERVGVNVINAVNIIDLSLGEFYYDEDTVGNEEIDAIKVFLNEYGEFITAVGYTEGYVNPGFSCDLLSSSYSDSSEFYLRFFYAETPENYCEVRAA